MDLERRSHRQVPGRKAMTTLLVKKEQTCHLEENPLYTVYPINRSKGLKKCVAKAEQKIINIQIRRQNWSQIGHTLRKPNCSVYKHALGWHLQEDGTHKNQGHSRNSCGKTRDDKMDRAGYPQGHIQLRRQPSTEKDGSQFSLEQCFTGGERIGQVSCTTVVFNMTHFALVTS